MSHSDAPVAPVAVAHRLGAPKPSTATAVGLGVAAGAGFVGAEDALQRLFGTAASAEVALGIVFSAALAWGVQRDVPFPGDSRRSENAARGLRWLGLGALSLLGVFAGNAGRAMAWMGGGVATGVIGETLARLVLGGILLGPVGLLAGSALRRVVRPIPEGDHAARMLAVAVATATLTALLARGAVLVGVTDSARIAGAFAGVVLLLAGVVAWRRRTPAPEDAGASGAPGSDPFPFLSALAVAFALVVSRFLATRAFAPVFGNELPDLPVADVTFATGLVLGTFVAAGIASRIRPGARAILVPVLGVIAGILAVPLLERRDPLPAALVAAVEKAASLDDVIREAVRITAPRTAPLGLLIGGALGLLVASIPGERGRRAAWLARVAWGAAVGAVLGTATGRLGLHPLAFEGALRMNTLIAAVLAAAAVAFGPFPRLTRAALAVGLPVLAGLVAGAVPNTDRRVFLVDRQLRSPGVSSAGVQKNWDELDEDDDRLAVAVLRRGQAKRVLVNGRFESSNESTAKTHGILAQLPLAFHPEPKRALIVGAGTGWALAVAEAHPLERIDLFDTGRAAVRAAVRMGPVARAAFGDSRLRIHLGDAQDLLGRAAAYDVILLEPAGAWSERATQVATIEFLKLVRARLREGGLVCLWIPDSALTREGFLVLLATWAHVFPHVEAWAGEGGDVLLLANKDDAPHDFARMLDAYRNGRVAAACRAVWIATPETMLSQFLIGDATVRRISADRAPSTRTNGALTRQEAARRRSAPTVNPVPGLAAIRDDVVATLVNTPAEGYAPAIAIAVRARDLQSKGLDLELDGKLAEAIAAYREALSLNPHDGGVRRAFASLRSQQGIEYGTRQSFLAAHAYMREAVEADSTYAQGFGNLGLLLAQAEQFDYALECTGRAIELAPDDDLFELQMGRIWKQRGYFDKALPFYAKAMQLNPKNVEAAIGYVDTKLAMEGDAADLRWGVAFLEKYRPLEPNHEDLLYRIGRLTDALAARATRPPDSAPAAGTPPADASPDMDSRPAAASPAADSSSAPRP